MKEVVVISGKGGTGKTSLTACFAVLCENAVVADCDVDAANLHLILEPRECDSFEFISGVEARVDLNNCSESRSDTLTFIMLAVLKFEGIIAA